jgi:hypothetical protein
LRRINMRGDVSRHDACMAQKTAKKFPLHPAHPEELFGPDWHRTGPDPLTRDVAPTPTFTLWLPA